jgi:hypothetical protein
MFVENLHFLYAYPGPKYLCLGFFVFNLQRPLYTRNIIFASEETQERSHKIGCFSVLTTWMAIGQEQV